MPELRSFDYIIVGGGAAACVLANRLTEDPGTKVVLIEKQREVLAPRQANKARGPRQRRFSAIRSG